MKYLILFVICFLLFSGEVVCEEQQSNWYDDFIFKDESFVFEFIRALGYANSGGADLGEAISTAKFINDGDENSWYDEWKKTADRLYASAVKANNEGHKITAAELFLRASNYYRAAGFYLRTSNVRPKAMITWQKSRESFNMALPILGNVEKISIPYKDTMLPGYFVKTQKEKSDVPLLIVHTGFDGTGEELYFEVAKTAIKRGYNCLIFEGPGQGAVIREQGLPFRYDWEKVVTPVVDYALSRSDVNADKISLMGISMGGYLAGRAVAFEERIKACVANGGVYSVAGNTFGSIGPELTEKIDSDSEYFNQAMEEEMKVDTTTKWFFENGMWTFNAVTPADLLLKMEKYTLKDIVKNIKCHMLIIDSQADMFYKGQPQKVYQELESPKTLLKFTKEDTAQAHCQMGAIAISNEKIFDWLDSIMK